MIIYTHLPLCLYIYYAGTYYKTFLVTSETSVGELIELALVKVNVLDNPLHYSIWQVVTSAGGGRDKQEKETEGKEEWALFGEQNPLAALLDMFSLCDYKHVFKLSCLYTQSIDIINIQ